MYYFSRIYRENYVDLTPREEEDEEEDEEDQEKLKSMIEKYNINSCKIFKSEKCIICLNNPSNVLFCFCGHIPICSECNEINPLDNCPICKTKNIVKRIIE